MVVKGEMGMMPSSSSLASLPCLLREPSFRCPLPSSPSWALSTLPSRSSVCVNDDGPTRFSSSARRYRL